MHNTRPVRRIISWFSVGAFCLAMLSSARAEDLGESKSAFFFKDKSGVTHSAGIVRHYWRVPIVHPFAKLDTRFDKTLLRAASFAQERSNAHSKARCWHYVKEALIASGAITSYPKSAYAFQAGDELVKSYGFKRLSVRDPYMAPQGAVLVYAHGASGFGHVEIRTKSGFVSDYFSKNRCKYPLIAAYAKYGS